MLRQLFSPVRIRSLFFKMYPMPFMQIPIRPLRYSFSVGSTDVTFKKIVSGFQASEINTILSEVSSLTSQDKQQALSLILKGVENQILPSSILVNSTFSTEVEKYPTIFIDLQILQNGFLLKELTHRGGKQGMPEQQISKVFQIIYNSLQKCQEKVQQITDNTVKNNYAIYLKREYSDIFVTHLCKYMKNDPTNELKQCIQIYRQHNQHIMEELQRLIHSLNSQKNDETQIKHEMLAYIETLTDNVLSIIQATNEIYHRNQKEDMLFQQISSIQEDIKSVLRYCQQLKGINFISVGYINLRKNEAFFNHLLLGQSQKTQEPKKQLVQYYNSLNRQFLGLLTEGSSRMPGKTIWDIALAMVSIKAEELDMKTTSNETLKIEITQFIDQILTKIKDHKHMKTIEENLNKTVNFILQYRQKK